MPLFPDTPIRLRLSGTLRQRPVTGHAALAVDADGVVMAPLHAGAGAAVERIAFASLDGVHHSGDDGGTITLCLRSGETLAGSGDLRVAELALDVLRRGRATPELTRAVRGLGTRGVGDAQEAFFRPLLEARRAAVGGGAAALDAFDGPQIRLAVEHILNRLAMEREPARAPAQRALEALLCEASAPLLAALDPLADVAGAARTAGSAEALRAWREWVVAVRGVFERADAAWLAVRGVLEAPRPAPPAATLDAIRLRWIG